MKEQITLFGEAVPQVINVASVPKRSPFRYPGGKTWLVPYIRQWLQFQQSNSKRLIEPFAGGGIVSLTAVFEARVKNATMVERDEDVAAVWTAILGDDAKWLAARIMRFEVTSSSVESVLSKTSFSPREQAFATILKNRVNHGGILANGAGLLKHGEGGKGLLSRWYPQTLKTRILEIEHFKNKILFIQGDGFEIMKKKIRERDDIFFIDPPYTKAGKRLYKYSEINHRELFALAAALVGDFLMTYDNAEEIRNLAEEYNFDTATVAMKTTQHTEKKELLISRNLDWVREYWESNSALAEIPA